MNAESRYIAIHMTRTIGADPDAVCDVWLDKPCPGSPWYGVLRVVLYPPEIDSLFYTMYEFDGREIAHYGRSTALDRPRKVQYTWVSEATHGGEALLTVTFEPLDGKTKVSVHHANVPDDEGGRRHKQAWGYVLARMSKYFEAGAAEADQG